MITVIVDKSVTKRRKHFNPNPPTKKQLTMLCRAVAKLLKSRGIHIDTFRFCVEKVYCPDGSLFHYDTGPNGDKSPIQTGGYLLRLYANDTPCVGWTMFTDKFNIDLLVEEAVDIADMVQLYVVGTWPYCDPNGDRRVELGLPREVDPKEGLGTPLPIG